LHLTCILCTSLQSHLCIHVQWTFPTHTDIMKQFKNIVCEKRWLFLAIRFPWLQQIAFFHKLFSGLLFKKMFSFFICDAFLKFSACCSEFLCNYSGIICHSVKWLQKLHNHWLKIVFMLFCILLHSTADAMYFLQYPSNFFSMMPSLLKHYK